MSNNVLGVVVTDGVGYRNFILSNFIFEAAKTYNKVIIYSGLPYSSFDVIRLPSNISIIELNPYKEGRRAWFYRKLKELAHMYKYRAFFGINNNLTRGYPKKNSPRALLTKLAYLIASIFHSEKAIQFFEKKQFKAFKKDTVYQEYHQLLKNNLPSYLFFTHQRPPYLAPILAVANKLQIKTAAFIFSWDNLASKGRMLGTFNAYLVWSGLMKKELLHFYPNTKKENVHVVGTPQFEPYVMDTYSFSKAEFLKKFHLNESKKIICYSCADRGIGQNDEIHIRAVLSFVKQSDDLQLLVRTSPAEDGKRFKKLREEFPQIKWNFPKWTQTRVDHAEAWSQRLPSVEDVNDLKAVLQYCDVNVNMLSTMSLDFMIFNKPVVNTVFGNKENGLYDDQRFLNYVHYKYVVDSGAVTIAKNEEELHQHLEEALNQPDLRSAQRKALIDLEIGAPLEGTSKRLVQALKELA